MQHTLQYYVGGQHAVIGPCASATLPLPPEGEWALDAPQATSLRQTWLGQYGITSSDERFLATWLTPGHAVDTCSTAQWIAALAAFLQALASGSPGCAQVVSASDREATLVIPSPQGTLAQDALVWAMRCVATWLGLVPSHQARTLHDGLSRWVQQQLPRGLPPDLRRWAYAAWQRGIPITRHPNGLQLGWGAAQRLISAEDAAAVDAPALLTLLSDPRTLRIPVTAVTGTNGKTTVSHMLHHIWLTAGRQAGLCTTEGLWIGRQRVSHRNLSGYPGARRLLAHRGVEAAVLEMPRKGLIKFGHPGDHYDVAVLLNVQDDHIGEMGVDSLQDMAELKASVLARARHAVVINADDPLCLAMQARARCPRRIWVTQHPGAPALLQHLAQGGEAVICMRLGASQTPWIVLAHGSQRTPVMALAEIPATAGGLLHFNMFNALAAVALAWAHGIRMETIRAALAGFGHGVDQNPGRLNVFEGHGVRVLLDYAHNPIGVQGLCDVIERLPVRGQRRLVCLGVGNRHAAHIDACAPLLARHFDQVVLGQDPHFVMKSRDYTGPDPCGAMLERFSQRMRSAGLTAAQLQVERDGARAVQRGIDQARPGDLLVLMAEERLAAPLLRAAGFTALRSLTHTADADPVARSA